MAPVSSLNAGRASGPGLVPRPPAPKTGAHRLPEVILMGVNASYRDKGGEISRKYGHTLIGTLRISYGSRFAKGCTEDEKLSDVLAKLDEPSLFKLVRDHKAGMLPIRLRTFPAGQPGK
jgi:hypothetical protein